jgi:hypothetical protein
MLPHVHMHCNGPTTLKAKDSNPNTKKPYHRLKAHTQRILITNVPFIITRGKDLRWITQKGSLRLFRSLRPARCSRSIDSARGVFYPASCQPRSASVARVTPIFKDKNRMHKRLMCTPGNSRTHKLTNYKVSSQCLLHNE